MGIVCVVVFEFERARIVWMLVAVAAVVLDLVWERIETEERLAE